MSAMGSKADISGPSAYGQKPSLGLAPRMSAFHPKRTQAAQCYTIATECELSGSRKRPA
jgi:hypothetical protein